MAYSSSLWFYDALDLVWLGTLFVILTKHSICCSVYLPVWRASAWSLDASGVVGFCRLILNYITALCGLANSVCLPLCLCSRIIPYYIQGSVIIVPLRILAPQQVGGKEKFPSSGISLLIMYCLPTLNPGDLNEGERRSGNILPPLPRQSYSPNIDPQHASVLHCLLASTTSKRWWWLALSIMPLHRRDFCRVGGKDFFYWSVSPGEPLTFFFISAEKCKLFRTEGNFLHHLPRLQ